MEYSIDFKSKKWNTNHASISQEMYSMICKFGNPEYETPSVGCRKAVYRIFTTLAGFPTAMA